MKKLQTITLMAFAALLFAGCRTQQPVIEYVDSVRVKERVVHRDSIVQVPADSAVFSALLECDSLNSVVMQELANKPGTETKIQYRYIRDTFRLSATVDSQRIYLAWKERHVTDTKRKTRVVTETITEKPTWMIVMSWIGIALSAVALIIFLLKIKPKI